MRLPWVPEALPKCLVQELQRRGLLALDCIDATDAVICPKQLRVLAMLFDAVFVKAQVASRRSIASFSSLSPVLKLNTIDRIAWPPQAYVQSSGV